MIVYPFSFIKSSADVALSNYVAPLLDVITNASSGNFTDFGNPVDESKYLNVSSGSWFGSPTSFNYQWFRNSSATFSGGVTISGYTSATYSLRWVDVTQYVYCQVTANTGAASVIARSDFRYVFDYDYYENLQTADASSSINSYDYQELISKQNFLMVELKNYNIWDKLDAFFVFASPGNEYYAMQNWKDPQGSIYGYSYNDGCTYTDLIGFQGGSDPMFSPPYAFNLNTGFNPEAHGVNYTQDDASRFFFPATFSDVSNYPMDGMNGDDLINTMWTGNSSANNRINTGDSLNSAFNFDRHLLDAKSIHRTSGSAVTLYNGGSSASRTATSVGGKLANGEMLILRERDDESLHTVAAYALGSSLVAEAVDFNAAWIRYAIAIGIPGYQ